MNVPNEVHEIFEGASRALIDVAHERVRQVSVEGWTEQHDDRHDDGTLSQAAAVYALHSAGYRTQTYGQLEVWQRWGWDWFKPKSLRRDLVRAAALIIADIERLDRASAAMGITTGATAGADE